jgi:hypothetical protein
LPGAAPMPKLLGLYAYRQRRGGQTCDSEPTSGVGAVAVGDHAVGKIVLAYELWLAGAGLGQLLAESGHIHQRQRRRRS